MATFLHTLWDHPVTHGIVTGWLTAALVDFAAFRSWKSFDEAWRYDWKLAAWRWCQGAVVGAVTGLGYSVT